MFNHLFRQLFTSCGIFVRTIQAFFTRKLAGGLSRVKRMTNFSRQATKIAADSFQGAAAAIKKPTKRGDFIETKRLFISKSFLILLVIALIALAVLAYFVVWPFLLSNFFTARFYVQDDRVATWTGRVAVYYDQERRQPMYEGRLEEGLLQGKGRELDEDGLVTYEGDFVDGLRSGSGSGFSSGVLVYQGQFDQGVYQGAGQRYQDGKLEYSGSFAAGVPEGAGTAYFSNGQILYKGDFSAGIYEGTGNLFYDSGQRHYQGGFSAGRYEGAGTEYRTTGQTLYQGGFSQGVYSGAGVYYPADGQSIAANFEAGKTDGAILWYKGGALYYDGAADDLTPSGFGTIYSTAGKKIYEGQMLGGTLDGTWLLTLTAADVRLAFSAGTLTEKANQEGGFTIASAELGAAVLCNYLQEEKEPMAYDIYLCPEGTDLNVSLLPWARDGAFSRWLGGLFAGVETTTSDVYVSLPIGVAANGGTFSSTIGALEVGSCQLLSRKAGEKPAVLHWSAATPLPLPPAEVPTAADTAQSRMESLLSGLDLIEDTKPAETGGAESGKTAPASADELGKILAAAASPADAKQMVDAFLDYLQNAETCAALTEKKSMLEEQLAWEQKRKAQGVEDQTVDTLTKGLDSLNSALAKCTAAMEKASLTVQSVGGPDPSTCDLQALTLVFDPAQLVDTELIQRAVAYAQAIAQDPAQVDPVALGLEIKINLIDLGTGYTDVLDALSAYQSAAGAAQTATGAYGTGSISKSALYDARGVQADCRGALYTALTAFTRYANQLNNITGGWVAQTYRWFPDAFNTVFGAALQKAADAAKVKAEEAAAAAIKEPIVTPPVIPTATPPVIPTATPSATPPVIPTATPSATPPVIPTATPLATPPVIPTATPTETPPAPAQNERG